VNNGAAPQQTNPHKHKKAGWTSFRKGVKATGPQQRPTFTLALYARNQRNNPPTHNQAMQFGVSSGRSLGSGVRGGEQQGTGLQADEEQARKFEEIISLLLAGGYFRARIATLDPFDKVRQKTGAKAEQQSPSLSLLPPS
jgi:hypothetical protein